MSETPTTLYLHGGPGLNCAVERAWFSEAESVYWWDQPRFPAEAENAYQATLDAATEILADLDTGQGKPVHLVACSFGARLALDLAHHAPAAIDTLTLLAPCLCLETAFERMANYLAAKGVSIPVVPGPVSKYCRGNHDVFMQRVMGIVAIPDVLSYYWSPGSGPLFNRHCAEAAATDWFDIDTFTAVSREIIGRPIHPLSASRVNRIRIFVGQHDPYFDRESDSELWETLFPEASIRIVDSSHMLPFEIPATEWLHLPALAKGTPP